MMTSFFTWAVLVVDDSQRVKAWSELIGSSDAGRPEINRPTALAKGATEGLG